MSTAFKTYEETYRAAVLAARQYDCDFGLEYSKLCREYVIRMLPNPKNRYGCDLRCEVVRKDSAL